MQDLATVLEMWLSRLIALSKIEELAQTPIAYFLPPPFDEGRCAKVLPAADLDAADVRPSRSTLLAAEAAFADETLFGDPVCERALPLEVFVAGAVDFDRRVEDAA